MYSIRPVIATALVLATNPSCSVKTKHIYLIFFIEHNMLLFNTYTNFGYVMRCSASAGILWMSGELPFGAVNFFAPQDTLQQALH